MTFLGDYMLDPPPFGDDGDEDDMQLGYACGCRSYSPHRCYRQRGGLGPAHYACACKCHADWWRDQGLIEPAEVEPLDEYEHDERCGVESPYLDPPDDGITIPPSPNARAVAKPDARPADWALIALAAAVIAAMVGAAL